jgi:hypothetical protein
MRTLAAIVLLAAVLGGCGSKAPNKANDYAVQVTNAQFLFANSFENATSLLASTTNPATDARALRQAAAAVNTDVRQLKAIKPPPEVRGLHRKLISLIDAYGHTVRHSATLVDKGDPESFDTAKRLLTASSATITDRFNTIVDKMNQQLR